MQYEGISKPGGCEEPAEPGRGVSCIAAPDEQSEATQEHIQCQAGMPLLATAKSIHYVILEHPIYDGPCHRNHQKPVRVCNMEGATQNCKALGIVPSQVLANGWKLISLVRLLIQDVRDTVRQQ